MNLLFQFNFFEYYFQVDATKHTLAKYLMELTMIEYDMAHLKPSHIAAASLFLAMTVLDGSRWVRCFPFFIFIFVFCEIIKEQSNNV